MSEAGEAPTLAFQQATAREAARTAADHVAATAKAYIKGGVDPESIPGLAPQLRLMRQLERQSRRTGEQVLGMVAEAAQLLKDYGLDAGGLASETQNQAIGALFRNSRGRILALLERRIQGAQTPAELKAVMQTVLDLDPPVEIRIMNQNKIPGVPDSIKVTQSMGLNQG